MAASDADSLSPYRAMAESISTTVSRVRVVLRDRPLTYSAAIQLLHANEDFRGWFNRLLADVPFPAYFWECPPITNTSADREFEFALVASSALGRTAPDPLAFTRDFDRSPVESTIVTLSNLGGDALLVIPRPLTEWTAYGHLAAFARQAPQEQVHALWRAVAVALAGRVGEQPVWLSTAGLGVPWLHVRLDSRPKYYRHEPYRHTP